MALIPSCPCISCGAPLGAVFGPAVRACAECGTEHHGRPAARRRQDPDWLALAPKAKRPYADDTPEPIVAPDAIVPFRVGREEARRILRTWARRQWFAPAPLRRVAESASFRGAYLPHWVWRAHTRSHYRGARAERRWARTAAGRARTLRWTPAAGTVERGFPSVPIPATVRLDARALADLMRDWTLADAVPFTPDRLEGYWVHRYDLEPEAGLALAKARMDAAVEADVRAGIGGDERHVTGIDTAYTDLAYRLVLLPVWLASYPHRGRARMVAVHGETGRVVGERPRSAAKLTAAFTLALALTGVILYFSA